jgi:hypothetical protein
MIKKLKAMTKKVKIAPVITAVVGDDDSVLPAISER